MTNVIPFKKPQRPQAKWKRLPGSPRAGSKRHDTEVALLIIEERAEGLLTLAAAAGEAAERMKRSAERVQELVAKTWERQGLTPGLLEEFCKAD